MRLRSVIAPSMSEGMRRVREQLGEDAIIVSTEETENGVLITAATERPEPPMPSESAAPPQEAPPERPAPARPVSTDDRTDEPPSISPTAKTSGTGIQACLDFHGVPALLAHRVASAAAASGAASAADALGDALDRMIGFSRIDPDSVRHPLMLVGEPGAGKTVLLAKLATQARLAGRKVTAITADTARSGGVEQLEGFMRAIGVDLHSVRQSQELAASVRSADPGSLVLIDTPAINPRDDEAAPVRHFLSERIEPVLVLPAGLQPEDAAETATLLNRALGVRRMIATRLDTARRYGAVIAAAGGGRISLGGLTDSRRIAEPLRGADPHPLALLLLNQFASRPRA